MTAPRAIIFDAYGTLLDVHSVIADPNLSRLWRQKQLEYTWLRSLMGCYEDFWRVTEDALCAAAAQLKIELTDAQVAASMNAYLRPAVFPDALAALEKLRGSRLAILSNGSMNMLEPALRHNGIEGCFETILSADRVRIYKPSPKIYGLGPEALQLPASEILFVSSNAWDAAGAKAFGYRVCWCNRSGAPMEHLGLKPDAVVTGLDQIASS